MTFSHNQPEYSVSEIASHVKRMVEETFGYVRVRGEVSKASVNASSGHCYLSLKDDKAVLDAIVWKGTMSKLAHKPQAGMEVIATGRLTTYPGSSKYQMVIEALEPAGIGALMAMLEQRKKQLAAEGLFDAARKKPLPFLPARIGIITSPTGAVIRDILHRLADRFPCEVLLWPVPVQGQGAAEKIAAAIAGLNGLPVASGGTASAASPLVGEARRLSEHCELSRSGEGASSSANNLDIPPSNLPPQGGEASSAKPETSLFRPDLIIVARGGGSIEDLWAFNEEVVVRAAAASAIPLISAVGHETDTTLIDFAADRRAPTPTAAAEMAVPVRAELLLRVEQLHLAQRQAVQQTLTRYAQRIHDLARGLPRPQQLVAGMAQALDGLAERLAHALPRNLQLREERLQRVAASLSPRFLHERLLRETQRVQHFGAMLESLNVLSVLKRGFVLVKDAGGQVVKAASAMPTSARLTLQFHDGERTVVTENAAPQTTPKPRSKKAAYPTTTQPGLFDS